MLVDKNTKLYKILKDYGDREEVLRALDIKSFGRYSFRGIVSRFVSVEKAAKLHKKDLNKLIEELNQAILMK